MCVGDDRHCLSTFAILEGKQKKDIRLGHHFYDLLIILLSLTHVGQALGLVPGGVSIYA